MTHGGRRKGAGRKPAAPTTVMRVPVQIVPAVEKLIQQFKLTNAK